MSVAHTRDAVSLRMGGMFASAQLLCPELLVRLLPDEGVSPCGVDGRHATAALLGDHTS